MKFKRITALLITSLFLITACNKGGVKPTPTPTPAPPVTPVEKHTVDLDLPDVTPLDEPSIQFHYWRKDCTYSGWNMWLWEGGKDGGRFDFNAKDEWGVVASYPLSTWQEPLLNQLGFIIRKSTESQEWAGKDTEADRFVDFSLYNKDAKDVYHIYIVSGDANLYLDTNYNMRGKLSLCTFSNEKRIAVTANMGIVSVKAFKNDVQFYENNQVGRRISTGIDLEETVDYSASYTVEVKLENDDVLKSSVSFDNLFGTEGFAKAFHYSGDDLGAVYTANKTTFKVWSPLSNSIILNVYESGTPSSIEGGSDEKVTYEMVKGEKGVFSYEVSGDLAGKYYTYSVTNSSFKGKEIVDPYAKSAGVNGLRGMIVDFSKTNPEGWGEISAHPYEKKSLTIYETHVADVTSSATWTGTEANRKLFKGMYESGTTYTSGNAVVKTGFDHIKELGVNAVQIIPLFDQANDELNMTFNWGYNPLNYNVVEGGYSSNPKDGYVRIKEFKELVKAYHDAGINIIMDVVYNHVNSVDGLCFDVLMPGYYFRYKNGSLTNGSGCGNETASEHYMMRKYIVDSVKFWASEYKLGGFRFDLMGLHDLTTMAEVAAEAKKINPTIAVFGEPWTGGDTPLSPVESAKQSNGNRYEGYGAFNDQMRDALIKGGLNAATDLGWITDKETALPQNDMNKILAGIKGITKAASAEIADPDKTVNYVTCHDNYTLYDRIIATKEFTAENEAEIKKMNVLANSVVFTSQGISFMLAGEEFLRTKQGNSNSYNASYEVNELDYSLKVKHLDMFHSYQKLIALKQSVDGLHLDKDHISEVEPTSNSNNSVIKYSIKDSTNNRQYMIIHANGLAKNQVVDLAGYTLYLSTINGEKALSANTPVEQYETIIAYKSL